MKHALGQCHTRNETAQQLWLQIKALQRLVFVFATALLLALSNKTLGQNLRIGLFNDLTTKSIVFTAFEGSYLMTADGRAVNSVKKWQNVMVTQAVDSVQCYIADAYIGKFATLTFKGLTDSCIFGIRVLNPDGGLKFFDNNLEVSVVLGKMQTINIVDIDKYIAGVVESEGGYKATYEYYCTQALLCRTYALSHLDRHVDENFYLCDGVHCQAYKSRSSGVAAIQSGAFDTRGLVVTDADTALITAAFSSNCGGQTESAQNVWLLNKTYLQPVLDPYCQNQKNYRWERSMSADVWKKYLRDNGYKLDEAVASSYLNDTQYSRKQYYKLGKDSVTFRKIRNDFKLKSAFFSIETHENNIELHGRGYGHGVGMCQEGAMQMAKLGYNFREIIQFYYQGVNVTDFQIVPESKNPGLKLLKHAF